MFHRERRKKGADLSKSHLRIPTRQPFRNKVRAFQVLVTFLRETFARSFDTFTLNRLLSLFEFQIFQPQRSNHVLQLH